ncbi:MAG TPA: hypothetical protein PKD51_10810 [Saprospiraceae bacterium]|nr:hypothetical protein [Saprospiraceae bacterium]
MFKYLYITFLLSISLLALSCTKEEVSSIDLKNTQISIIKPIENLEISLGDTLQIEALITSDVNMHGYEIIIYDITTKTQKSILDKHTHGKQLSINQTWIASNETLGQKEIEVVAIIDHTGLKTTAKRKIIIR